MIFYSYFLFLLARFFFLISSAGVTCWQTSLWPCRQWAIWQARLQYETISHPSHLLLPLASQSGAQQWRGYPRLLRRPEDDIDADAEAEAEAEADAEAKVTAA